MRSRFGKCQKKKGRWMKKFQQIVLVATVITGASASAVLIASDSFRTGARASYAAGMYTNGQTFLNGGNSNALTGTFGFTNVAGKTWLYSASSIVPRTNASLTHAAVAGITEEGSVCINPSYSDKSLLRNSNRRLADAKLSGTTFFMSGLVNVGALSNLDINDTATMGMSDNIAVNSASLEKGLHFGVTKDSAGDVYLAVFAGGKTHLLGSAMTSEQAAQTQMIILQLDVDDGNDTLKVWVLGSGETKLTILALDVADFDIGSLSNLTCFAVQAIAGQGSAILKGVYMDEFRFGTSLSDVTVFQAAKTVGCSGISDRDSGQATRVVAN
jgi:hypothetical protein